MDIYGVIGWPIKHSLSPVMHNAAFKELGIDAEYRKFEVKPEGLEDFLLKRKEVKGFNITIPHKVEAREILEQRFPLDKDVTIPEQFLYYVKLSGAINTVKRVGEKIEYYNTDATGFIHSLEQDLKFNVEYKNIFLFGCGGAGRAVISALSWRNADVKKIYVYDINRKAVSSAEKHFFNLAKIGDYLREKIKFISEDRISEKINECQLLVNASSVGMKEGDGSIIDKKLLRKDLFIYDLVYNRETELVRDARTKGARAENGRGMLAAQGAFSFSLWRGVPAADVVGVMRKELDSHFKTKA